MIVKKATNGINTHPDLRQPLRNNRQKPHRFQRTVDLARDHAAAERRFVRHVVRVGGGEGGDEGKAFGFAEGHLGGCEEGGGGWWGCGGEGEEDEGGGVESWG